jgi:hypothetical protein
LKLASWILEDWESKIEKQADSLKPIMPQAALQQSQETKLTNQATAKTNIYME